MIRFSEKLRYGSLGALLVLTLIAAAVPGERDDGVVEAVDRPPARAPADPGGAGKEPPPIALDKLHRPTPQGPAEDLFAVKSWYVAPPPPPPVAYVPPPPPPPPTAPPLPFSYMGKVLEEGQARSIFFLVKGDRLYAVAEGEVIDNTYRVEGISSGQLGLRYLPLDVRQFIPIPVAEGGS